MLRLKYVGIAVTDINDAIKTYEQFFGMKQMTPVKQARWGFVNCMMGDGFEHQVEQARALARGALVHESEGHMQEQALVGFAQLRGRTPQRERHDECLLRSARARLGRSIRFGHPRLPEVPGKFGTPDECNDSATDTRRTVGERHIDYARSRP